MTFGGGNFAARFGAVLQLPSGVDLLWQPKVAELVRRALEYRKTRAVIVESGADRLIIELGDVPMARIEGRTLEGEEILEAGELETMAVSGGAFGLLLETAGRIAS